MSLQLRVQFIVIAVALLSPVTRAFLQHTSLAGLSERDVNFAQTKFKAVVPPPPPGPLKYDGTKRVDDHKHPWMPPRRGDIRGPCPGLNTMASHGVSDHSLLKSGSGEAEQSHC